MADLRTPPRFKVTDKVRTTWGARLEGRVMEVMPARTPEAHTLYSVHVPMDPEPLILLVRENEIEQA